MLLLPTSAQVQTSGGGLPKFSGTDWPLNACVLPGLDALLGPIPGATAGTERLAFTAGAPGGADALFNALRNYFNVGPPDPTPNRLARLNSVRIKKELPPSYTSAFSFERPRAGTTTDNEFGCSLRDNVPALPGDPKPPQGLTWGAVLSYALRQPLLARALGLISRPDDPARKSISAPCWWMALFRARSGCASANSHRCCAELCCSTPSTGCKRNARAVRGGAPASWFHGRR